MVASASLVELIHDIVPNSINEQIRGPLNFEVKQNDGSLPTLVLNPNSWSKVASIIYVDLPVGTGFSYGTTSLASKSTDLQSCDHAYEFLRKWLIDHLEFLSNPIYVGGDSYSGLTVPIIVQLISNGKKLKGKLLKYEKEKYARIGVMPRYGDADSIRWFDVESYCTFHILNCFEDGDEPFESTSKYIPQLLLDSGLECQVSLNSHEMKLALNRLSISRFVALYRGYLLGNPLTNLDDDNYRIPFAHGMGLISDELYECIDGLPKDQILEPYCGFDSPKPQELFSERRFVNEKYIKLLVHQLSPCDFSRINAYKLSHLWLNNDRVREALHIRKGSTQEWIRCNYGLPYTKSILDSFQYHVNLSTKGYRSLIYRRERKGEMGVAGYADSGQDLVDWDIEGESVASGDHDMGVPFLGTQAWIRELNYSIVDEWRSWWVQGQVAGYTRTYSNRMTFATVKGGGHIPIEYKPVECYAMFKRLISNQPL
ncbi:hypothetical protein TEA_010422 [Camellia sinensis var. sinensis]|uniref:Uncharacterized protein n=1 Tax=Camellia sinensis var. sinensis TaxID=542762 RepID=A0A4S4EGB3_CAMSN|nr:hypothetical protein TEA_010422 [Camellia sinensis var. sinensis]